MPRFERRKKRIVWAVSAAISIAVVLFAMFTMSESPFFDDYLFFAVVSAVFPAAILDYFEYRRKESIDEHLPDLFRSIVSAQQTGMTLPQALEEASKRDYGPLTEELKKMVNQMSWGLPFDDGLREFSKRVDTPLTRRTWPLIGEANRSGGQVEKIFAPMGRFVETTLTMKKKRRAQTRPYIAIIYVAFFVFVFTLILLFKTFFATTDGSPVIGFSTLSSSDAWRLFFHMNLIQACCSGLVAGKMGEGNLGAGLKHATILLASGYLASKLIVW